MRYTNAQIAKVVKYIIENVEMLNNALDDALRVTEIEQQNQRYKQALEEIKNFTPVQDTDSVVEIKGIAEEALK